MPKQKHSPMKQAVLDKYADAELRVLAQEPIPAADDYASLPGVKRPVPERLCARAKETLAAHGGERMESTTDWRMAVFNGETELGLEAWRAEFGS